MAALNRKEVIASLKSSAALVAAIEADLEKRKARADRFGIAWELSAFDIERLECAKKEVYPFRRNESS